MGRIVNASPKASSEIEMLSRIGYNLNSAISDIIDNSLHALHLNKQKKPSIYIEILPGLDSPKITIRDNGIGMNAKELKESMIIGCKNPNDSRGEMDLGRFGSGMKTASFSLFKKSFSPVFHRVFHRFFTGFSRGFHGGSWVCPQRRRGRLFLRGVRRCAAGEPESGGDCRHLSEVWGDGGSAVGRAGAGTGVGRAGFGSIAAPGAVAAGGRGTNEMDSMVKASPSRALNIPT
jgi:hypothetical protein